MLKDSRLLELIMSNLKTCGKHILVKDENNHIIFPRDIESLEEIERLDKSRKPGKEFYDKETGNNYEVKSCVIFDDNQKYIFELIENNNKYKKIEKRARYDSATNLLNKESVLIELDNCIINKDGNINSLSVVVCDIDLFKSINDTFSHLAGDQTLKKVAEILKNIEDKNECIVGRFGGDEFIIIFKNYTFENTMEKLEQIREEMKTINIPYNNAIIDDVTMSFGVYNINEYYDLNFTNIDEIIEVRNNIFSLADEALYKSKKDGRDKITVTNDIETYKLYKDMK